MLLSSLDPRSKLSSSKPKPDGSTSEQAPAELGSPDIGTAVVDDRNGVSMGGELFAPTIAPLSFSSTVERAVKAYGSRIRGSKGRKEDEADGKVGRKAFNVKLEREDTSGKGIRKLFWRGRVVTKDSRKDVDEADFEVDYTSDENISSSEEGDEETGVGDERDVEDVAAEGMEVLAALFAAASVRASDRNNEEDAGYEFVASVRPVVTIDQSIPELEPTDPWEFVADGDDERVNRKAPTVATCTLPNVNPAAGDYDREKSSSVRILVMIPRFCMSHMAPKLGCVTGGKVTDGGVAVGGAARARTRREGRTPKNSDDIRE